MEQTTLGFFIGVQNMCISHNKMITSLQWLSGNLFFLLSVGLSIWFFVLAKKKAFPKIFKQLTIGYWVIAGVFFIGYNTLSLSLPIDEREAMEEVLKKKPALAKQVRKELSTLQTMGHNLD
jgi:hypothetical protein